MNREVRFTTGTVEVRSNARDGKSTTRTLAGYAAKYDTLSQNLGGFVETIRSGAFDKSIADKLDVVVRYNHDDAALLGRTSSGTARVGSDSVGLWYEVDLPDTTVARDLAVLAERGDVHQSSFAFLTVADSWGQTEQGFPLRSLNAARLVDVAPVNTPAYLDTSSGLRSFAEARGLPLDEVEAAARAGHLADLLTSEPTEARDATDGTDDTPQVDNHGLIVVRQRLMQLRLRRTV